ncbi:MAG: hypothetical protein ACI4DK_09385 [Lachnospiraceae bacterium]
MYITRKCEAGISSDDMLYPIQNTEIISEEQKSGMGFIMTLYLLEKYLEKDGKKEEVDIVYVYREILEELQSEKVSQCVKKFQSAFKKYIRICRKNEGQKKKIMKNCMEELCINEIAATKIIIDSPSYAAEKIASWMEAEDCAVLVNLEAKDFSHTLAFVRKGEYVYYMDIGSKIEGVLIHRKKVVGCITLTEYIRSRICSYYLQDRRIHITSVICSWMKYQV